MNLFLFIAGILVFTIIGGKLIEKIRVPRVFSALFLGLILSVYNPFVTVSSSDTFQFMADMGMYFLLFIIGLELDIKAMFKQGRFIPKLSFLLFLGEAVVGSLFIHYVFSLGWGISILTASSFATVGEAILIPILDEFKIIKTQFGQTILGVGTIDDVVEIITIIVASVLLGESIGVGQFSVWTISLIIAGLLLVPILLYIFRSKLHQFKFKQVPTLFLFGLIILFIFVGVGNFADASALGAILAGISIKNFISTHRVEKFEEIIRIIAYGLLVPIFFLSVGMHIDLHYLLSAPGLILIVLLITTVTKIAISFGVGKGRLGTKKSILLGIGLSAKFSTSIVILTMLMSKHMISQELYSVLIGAMIVSQFLIPVSFSLLLKKWGLSFKRSKSVG